MRKNLLAIFFIGAAIVFIGAGCISFKKTTASGPMGIFRTPDKGETWVQASVFPTAQGVKMIADIKTHRLFEDPSDANALYLGSRGQGLFYSYNNGDTWQSVPYFNGKFIYALAVDPKDKCNIYVSDGVNIYKSEDCTRNWRLIFTEQRPGERLTALDIDSTDGTIWGALLGGDVMASRDNGYSWTIVKRFNFKIQDLTVDKKYSGRVYVASQRNGLYRTDDGGINWVDLREGMKSFSDSYNCYRFYLNLAQDNSLFWISKYGILRSDDSGVTWTDLKLLTPPGTVSIFSFAVNPKNQREIYYTGTELGEKEAHIRSTFYKSVDGGVTWVTKKLPTNTMPFAMRVHPQNDSMLFIGFSSLQ
jgi:hypothetical protein